MFINRDGPTDQPKVVLPFFLTVGVDYWPFYNMNLA